MKKLKRRLRRGSAMPMAIIVLLMLTAFSILILSTTMLEGRHAERRDRLFRERLAVDAAAEDCLAAVLPALDDSTMEWNGDGFSAVADKDGNNVRVVLSDNGGECLTITLSDDGSGYTITAWTYH